MSLAPGWIETADDPWGEALKARLWIRADTAAGADQLIELTALENVVDLDPLSRRREREPGVVQGQTWSIRLTNDRGTFNPRSADYFTTQAEVEGEWVALTLEFPVASQSGLFAQGRVERIEANSDGSATIFVDHVMVSEIIEWTLPRPLVFDERDAWASPVYTVKIADGSDEYDNTTGKPLQLNAGVTSWETFRIVFATSTTFNVVRQDGTNQSGGPFSIAANRDITSIYSIGAAVVRIYAAGWSGTYNTGDEFVVHTSPQIASNLANPVEALRACIDMARTQGEYTFGTPTTIPDVIGGGTMSIYDDSDGAWTDAITLFSTVTVRGYFAKGTRVIDMIQALLRFMNASLFPSRSGQVGIWVVNPRQVGSQSVVVTGDPAAPNRSILNARRYKDRTVWATRVAYKYRSLGFTAGQDGVDTEGAQPGSGTPGKFVIREATVDVSDPSAARLVGDEIDLLWALDEIQVESAANKHLNRFKQPNDAFVVDGTLTSIAHLDLHDVLSITEPELDEVLSPIQALEVVVDPLRNQASVVGQYDPVVFGTYAQVDLSVVDGSDGHRVL